MESMKNHPAQNLKLSWDNLLSAPNFSRACRRIYQGISNNNNTYIHTFIFARKIKESQIIKVEIFESEALWKELTRRREQRQTGVISIVF